VTARQSPLLNPLRSPLLASAIGTTVAARLLHRWPPGGGDRWRRTNHRGEPVTLLEGPAVVLGATAGLLAAPGIPPRVRAGGAVALLAAGALGAYDDLAGDGGRKGLAGHLGALAHGELTTGAVKLVGLALAGLVSAAASGPGRGSSRPAALRAVDTVVAGAVVAGSANLVNLLDLRPGRAVKAVALQAVALQAAGSTGPAAGFSGPAAAALGAAAAALPADLRERTMLGDCGANATGALLGVAAVCRLGPRGRAGVLAALLALTVASERVSFTKVIEATPVLRELDALGRRRHDVHRTGTP